MQTRTPMTVGVMAGYAAAEIGITAVEVLAQIYLLEFFVSAVGLKASLAGLALSLAVLWDAISDPLMGTISDRTKTKFGKRRPYILVGGFLLAMSIYWMFSPPQLETQTEKFFFLLGIYLLVNTAMTVLAVPHIALGGEMTFVPSERTRIFGWRFFFSNVGFILVLILPSVFSQIFPSINETSRLLITRSYTAMTIAGILIFTSILTFFCTKGRDRSETENGDDSRSEEVAFRSYSKTSRAGKPSIVRTWTKNLKTVFKNLYFLPLIAAFIIATFGRTFNSSIVNLYYKYRIRLTESEIGLWILLPFVVCLILSIFLWVYLSGQFGKKKPAFWGIFLLGIMTVVVYPLFPERAVVPIFFTAVLGGFFAGAVLLFDSLVADIVDYDELKTGQKREGWFFGLWKMATKTARALGLGLGGFLLGEIGYQEGSLEQIPELGFRLSILFGPVVGGLFLLGAFVFLAMPLTGERHVRIQSLLLRKREIRKKIRT
ncbi:MFS transporter [Leptospira gomenensis]|uniref:MFS transporter n=1 Tax=Leptospira gomenensis TaxID=2484974 RepID=A0A5F1YAC0_9LEPT|nr:MFS transporter [Leptospira gomenensis]TGK33813.1 MFS transporter [Leptospira gomenensis]TGK42994.1 MFS transporter [Leptospira gomenensis]TGK44943.1 MFS transporter [Leptospira gomenensis]TGK59913.1 MFS transporter [Leptospira gomenensis]